MPPTRVVLEFALSLERETVTLDSEGLTVISKALHAMWIRLLAENS